LNQLKIVFFDGNCPMCNAWVKRIIRWDKEKKFHFAPLEGETAREMLAPVFPGYLAEDTIVLYDEGNIYLRSAAALRIMNTLRLPFKLMSLFALVPSKIRDWVYDRVAANRYRYGPRYDSCPVPPREWKDRFLR
jgi:predicted DCC family thiol-disulfide oxidoreductase YuxK